MIKAVIFDMGGVVLKAKKKNLFLYFGGVAKKLNIGQPVLYKLLKRNLKEAYTGKLSTKGLLKRLSGELGISQKEIKKQWERAFIHSFSLDNKVIEIVDKLKSKGYVTALLTNTIKINSDINEKKGYYDKFSPKLLSWKTGLMKPYKRAYRLMLKKLMLKPQECVFVDDKKANLKPAKTLGMKAILFKNAKQLKRELKKLNVDI